MLTYGGWSSSRHWGVSGDPDAGQVRGQLVGADIADLRGGSLQQPGNDRLPNDSTRQREAAVRVGMVESQSSEMSVEMLSPSSAAELPLRGTMHWQSCHKEHSMFRVSAPPKPQTPGPSRPVPSSPARSLARVNSRPGDDDGRRIVIWH